MWVDIRKHNPNKTPKYHECIDCKKVFQLHRHLKIHTDKGVTSCICVYIYIYIYIYIYLWQGISV